MGVSIDQMTNDGYFPTQKDHIHLLEGVSNNISSNSIPFLKMAFDTADNYILRKKTIDIYMMCMVSQRNGYMEFV